MGEPGVPTRSAGNIPKLTAQVIYPPGLRYGSGEERRERERKRASDKRRKGRNWFQPGVIVLK